LAVDELMDMARTMINVIGNALASVVIAKWEGVFGTAPEDAVGLEEPAPKREADVSVSTQ
jgi:proton glutamate symport protein